MFENHSLFQKVVGKEQPWRDNVGHHV
jgi:hypothetical protein